MEPKQFQVTGPFSEIEAAGNLCEVSSSKRFLCFVSMQLDAIINRGATLLEIQASKKFQGDCLGLTLSRKIAYPG